MIDTSDIEHLELRLKDPNLDPYLRDRIEKQIELLKESLELTNQQRPKTYD